MNVHTYTNTPPPQQRCASGNASCQAGVSLKMEACWRQKAAYMGVLLLFTSICVGADGMCGTSPPAGEDGGSCGSAIAKEEAPFILDVTATVHEGMADWCDAWGAVIWLCACCGSQHVRMLSVGAAQSYDATSG